MAHQEPARLPALKLIAAALMAGVLLFSAFAAFMTATGAGPAQPGNTSLLAIITAALALTSIPFAFAAGAAFTAAARSQWPARRDDPRAGDWLLNQFATLTLLRIAMVEAVGLLGAVGLLLTGRWLFLAAPLAGLLVWLIRSFGGYPDGVAFAVLLANITVPLIDYYTRPRVYGHR